MKEENSDDAVGSAIAKAVATLARSAGDTLPSGALQKALAEVTALKGIGPCTASLLLSYLDARVAASDKMQYLACGWPLPLKYNLREVLDFNAQISEIVKSCCCDGDGGSGKALPLNARDVSRAFLVLYIESKNGNYD